MLRGRAAARSAGACPKSAIDRIVRSPGAADLLELGLDLGVSQRRLLGWEPEERHEHYDAEGNLTGYTIVTREPEYDDAERQRYLAYLTYQRGICDCGIHESLANDKSNVFTFEKRTCPVCKGFAQWGRVLEDEDRATAKKVEDLPPVTPRPSDGRRLMIRQLSPLEVAARRATGTRPPTTE